MEIIDSLFWSNTKSQPSSNGCIEYALSVDEHGYGRVKRKGRSYKAHRYAWYLKHGYWPEKHILHKCDNRPCCNTEHLFEGNDKDNSDDKISKGRARSGDQKGFKNGNARITREQMGLIISMIKDGFNNCHIGRTIGVTHQRIWQIRRNMVASW